jgi:hypothetical protein
MNPDLEQELGLTLFVRSRDLHCRRGWNDDKWSAASDDIVLDVRFKSPARDLHEPSGDNSVTKRDEARSIEAIVLAWDEPARAEANADSPRP